MICVCCLRDAATWRVASQYIFNNIQASHYKVIVPDSEVDQFREITPSNFDIIRESIYKAIFSDKLRSFLGDTNRNQYGWYLQQFIKLAALNDCKENQIALIWDADTVPIKKLNFISQEGKLIYYKSDEFHKPYFATIDRLLGLNKIVSFSFIAQNFVIRSAWMHEFAERLENKFQLNWIEALLQAIDFNEGNGFSEYETLGTFLTHYHYDQIEFTDKEWLRLGNSTIGHIAFLNKRSITRKLSRYDFVSFEKWDRIRPYFWKVIAPYFLRKYLG